MSLKELWAEEGKVRQTNLPGEQTTGQFLQARFKTSLWQIDSSVFTLLKSRLL